MSNQNSTSDVEIAYQEVYQEELELLDEAKHYNSVDLVREINRLKKEIYVLRTKKS